MCAWVEALAVGCVLVPLVSLTIYNFILPLWRWFVIRVICNAATVTVGDLLNHNLDPFTLGACSNLWPRSNLQPVLSSSLLLPPVCSNLQPALNSNLL